MDSVEMHLPKLMHASDASEKTRTGPYLELGMAIPQRISFLEESRSRGIAKLHSSGIEEYEIYSSGSSGNFRGLSYPKILKIPPKFKKILTKN